MDSDSINRLIRQEQAVKEQFMYDNHILHTSRWDIDVSQIGDTFALTPNEFKVTGRYDGRDGHGTIEGRYRICNPLCSDIDKMRIEKLDFKQALNEIYCNLKDKISNVF